MVYVIAICLQIAVTQPNCMKVLPLTKKENTHRVKVVVMHQKLFCCLFQLWFISYAADEIATEQHYI